MIQILSSNSRFLNSIAFKHGSQLSTSLYERSNCFEASLIGTTDKFLMLKLLFVQLMIVAK